MTQEMLKVVVTKKAGVKVINFAYDEDSASPNNPVVPFPVSPVTGNSDSNGKFPAQRGVPGRLFWGIRGDAGGSMKVEVFDSNDVPVNHRERSDIKQNGRGADYLDILF